MTVVEQAVAAMEEAKQEILKLRQRNTDMLAALRQVEAHHVLQNYFKGRPEANSHTLGIVREAIRKAEANDEL